MQKFINQTLSKLTAAVMLVTALFGSSLNLTVAQAAACTPTNTDPDIHLWAQTGNANLYGNTAVSIWGYSLGDANAANGPATLPGPVLDVNVGDCVQVTLHNVNIPENTSLLFQGQSLIPDTAGVGAGGTAIYTFAATHAGTFLYEAGLTNNAPHQVAMGMYGALIVRPAAGQVYDTASIFTKENILVLSEYDPAVAAAPAAFDMRNYNPDYLLINGKAYPGTAEFSVAANDVVALRYVNAGLQAHSMSTLGLTQTIIGQDGHKNTHTRRMVAETIATGETLDTLVTIPAGAADGTKYAIYDANMLLRNNTGGTGFEGFGGMLTTLTVGTVTGSPDTAGPIASNLALTSSSTDGTVDVDLTATITDALSNVAAAEYYLDSTASSATPMAAVNAPFDAVTEDVTATISSGLLSALSLGDHTLYVRGRDAVGNWGPFATITLTITTTAPASSAFYLSRAGIGDGPIGSDPSDVYFFDGASFTADVINVLDGANLDGFVLAGTDHYFMSFTAETIVGAVTAQPEDVVEYDGGTWTLSFDGSAYGLAGSNVDAIDFDGSTLYFSLSDGTLPTGVVDAGDGADIYAFSGSAITRYIDASASGMSDHNVDGFVYVDATHFYLSYSPTTTAVPGVGMAQDEDILYFSNGTWTTAFDGTVNGLTTPSLDVDAFDIP